MNELAIIILNWNGHDDTVECIKSIRKNEEQLLSIFLLDNGSKFESVEYIENWIMNEYQYKYEIIEFNEFNESDEYSQSDLYFIKGKINLGFAKGNNVICEKIKNTYNYVLLLNNDTIVDKNSITNMIEYMNDNPDVGALSCDIRLYSDRNKLWNAGGYFTWYGDRKYYKQSVIDNYKSQGVKSISTPFITGCAMLVRKSISNTVGLFTGKFFFGEEDFNYCKRLLKAGIKVESVLDSTIYHKVGTSIKKNQKLINGFILHFSNRIINQKEFIPKSKWLAWKELYILAIFIKVWRISKSFKTATKVNKSIRHYTSNYNEISYDTFIEINAIK